MKFLATIAALTLTVPALAQSAPVFVFFGESTEASRKMTTIAGNECEPLAGKGGLSCFTLEPITVYGMPLEALVIQFHNDTLDDVWAEFEDQDYGIVREAIVKKYGKPAKETEEEWQNPKSKKTIKLRTALWEFKRGDLILKSKKNGGGEFNFRNLETLKQRRDAAGLNRRIFK